MRGNSMATSGLTSTPKIGLGLWIYPQEYFCRKYPFISEYNCRNHVVVILIQS